MLRGIPGAGNRFDAEAGRTWQIPGIVTSAATTKQAPTDPPQETPVTPGPLAPPDGVPAPCPACETSGQPLYSQYPAASSCG